MFRTTTEERTTTEPRIYPGKESGIDILRSAEIPRTPSRPELLAPGGSLEKSRIALLYGADAVYVGGKDYSLRAYARNLTREELATIRYWAHLSGKRVYVTVNTFARHSELKSLPPYLEYLQEIGIDGLIVSDPGVIRLARQWAPLVPLHLSTQANTTNALSVRFWEDLGIRRINLARELSFQELSEICVERRQAELEVFVHGAMCVSYSGRCLLSALLNQRSANRGLCTQPCRWSYRLVEEKRPGQYFPIHEDDKGSYIFNSKDLCLLEELGSLMALGLDAFKIEGRMKGALYLAAATRAYRQAMDRYWNRPEAFQADQRWTTDLERVSHRPYTTGFLYPEHTPLEQAVAPSISYCQTHTLAGLVRSPFDKGHDEFDLPIREDQSCVYIEVRSRLEIGAILEFLYPDGTTVVHRLDRFEDLRGNALRVAHPNSWIALHVPFPTFPFQVIRMPRLSRSS